jgi:hypothetical protein
MSAIIASVNEHIGVYLKEIFQILLAHDTILDNEMVRLQEFADKFALNLYMYIIDHNGGKFCHLYASTVHKSGKSSRAFLVFDKRSQEFYSFYLCDKNNKKHTTFSMNDKYTQQLFNDLVQCYKWSSGEVLRQSSDQDIFIIDQQNDTKENMLTTNINHHIGL